MRLTKNQSLYLGFGTLVLFFGLASLQIARNSVKGSIGTPVSMTDPGDAPVEHGDAPPADGSSPIVNGADGPHFELKDFHRSETKDGKKLWEVTAKRGQYYPSTNTARVFDAVLFLFREGEEKPTEMVANEALIHLSGTTFTKAEASGGVVLRYDKQGQLETDYAVYDRENESMTAPGWVKITNEKLETTGVSLVADLKQNEFVLEKDVHSIVKGKPESSHAPSTPK